MVDNYWTQCQRTWRLAVDPANDGIVVYREDDGRITIVDFVAVTKPKAEWEGGDWLFHVARASWMA